uniref:Putative agglucetin1 n=1 Tax=Reticulitermes speratus TaxID=60591 RepID=A0A1V1FYE5_9NEOP
MATRRFTLLFLVAILAAELTTASSRAVNISNAWLLPQEGFPVFYRYFRDRITWFEADAVCQFHHGNLVTVDSSKQYDTTRAYLKELDVVTNVWIGLKKKGPNDEFSWTDYKTLSQDGGYWQEQIPKTEAALCAAIDPAADFRWHSLNCGGPETASFICELPVPPWAWAENGCMLTALPSLTVIYLPEQAAVELTSDCGMDGTRQIACKGQADHNEMMRQLSCDNGNESSHEVEEEDRPVSPSSTTLGTASDSSAGGTESHQPPTRHRRDADDVSPLPRTLRSTSTEEDEASSSDTSTYIVTSTAVTVTTNRDTPEEANITTTEQFTALEVVSATDGLTLTGNHVQQIYTTTEPSTLAATKMVPTEYFVTAEPHNISVTVKDTVQKITTDKPYHGQSTEKTQTTGRVSTPPVLLSPTDLSTINTAVETSASLGVLNEAKEITISLAEDNVTKNNTGEMNMKDEIFLPETIAVTIDTYTIRSIINTTASSSSNESVSMSDEEYIKPSIKESTVLIKQNTETDDQDLKENHRRQFLPAPLRGPSQKIDSQTNENVTKSTSNLASPSNHQDEGELIQPVETEPEVPARPNRGRRLTRPHHAFYPYFLNRILG